MRYSWLTVILFFQAWAVFAAGESPPAEVGRAAEAGLPRFLEKIPAGALADYGFNTVAEREQARLGAPFRLAVITPQTLLGYQAGDAFEALLTDTTLWYFPVAIDGAIRCLLVVDRMPAGWEAVSLGYVPLARALDALLRAWPESDGNRPRLVAVFQAREYLYTVPGQATPNLTPLTGASGGGAGSATALSTTDLTQADTTLRRLRPLVEQNLRDFGAAGEER
jgi:hypothetical protein